MQIEKCNDVKMLQKMKSAVTNHLERVFIAQNEVVSNQMLLELMSDLTRVEQRIVELTKEKI